MVGLMKTAARELGDHNVRVNIVAPGGNPHPGEPQSPGGTLLKRRNNPEEVAAFFLHLSRMKNVSGQFFNVDSQILF